jgi:hypothetical protein
MSLSRHTRNTKETIRLVFDLGFAARSLATIAELLGVWSHSVSVKFILCRVPEEIFFGNYRKYGITGVANARQVVAPRLPMIQRH